MGICVEKTSFSTSKLRSTRANPNYRESFLYSSFTYDPSYTPDSEFFFFDLPHYCEIQYILRKSHPAKELAAIQANVQQHIEEIQAALVRYTDPKFRPGFRVDGKDGEFKKKEEKMYEEHIEKVEKELSVTSQKSGVEQFNHCLNFQLVSATVSEWENMEEIPFYISLNGKKIMTIVGNINQGKWKPTSIPRISLPNTTLQFQDIKSESNIKIWTQLDSQQLQCTIPCNKIVFKYIIPVLQTSNIRRKEDNEPLGHAHFKIQYIGDFQQHKKRVIQDLIVRKKGLQAILDRIKMRDQGSMNEKSLIVEEWNQSFRSELKE